MGSLKERKKGSLKEKGISEGQRKKGSLKEGFSEGRDASLKEISFSFEPASLPEGRERTFAKDKGLFLSSLPVRRDA